MINSPMPFVWQRSYASDNSNTGMLGQGWMLLLDSFLSVTSDKTLFTDPTGRELEFDAIAVGGSSPWVTEQLILSHPTNGEYRLATADNALLIFTPGENPERYRLHPQSPHFHQHHLHLARRKKNVKMNQEGFVVVVT